MRIAHVLLGRCNPDSANGVDKTVYYLAHYQASLGGQVAVFSLTDKDPIPVPGVEVRTLQAPKSKLERLLPVVPRKLFGELLDWRPDIVHFHSAHIGLFVALGKALRRKGIPYVVTPNGAFAPGRLARVGPEVRGYVRLIEKAYLEESFFVHAVSRNDAEGLHSLGIKAKVVIVPNGFNLSDVPSHPNADLLRERFPYLKGKRVFLFLGRLDPLHKGLDLLLEAFAGAELPETHLVLVGPDWRGSLGRLHGLARRLGVEERVTFTGPAYGEEKWAYLAGADVFVHPSRWEGVPFSVLEAMAVGKPVLVSRAADPEDVGLQRAGVTVELGVSELCQALRFLGNADSEILLKMGSRARTLVEERFNWRSLVARIMEAYRSAER